MLVRSPSTSKQAARQRRRRQRQRAGRCVLPIEIADDRVISHRVVVDPTSLPGWLQPYTIASMRAPRSHAELAKLYRNSRAVVIFERTVAIFEALACGCPIICIGNDNLKE